MIKRSRAPQRVLEEVERRAKEAKRLGLLPHMIRGGDFEVRRFAGPARWTEALDGLRITHLTDLHVGRVTPMEVQREAIAIANAQSPDLVALTGDFVCHSLNYLDELSETLRGLDAPAIAVLGNHDYWAGGEDVQAALERAGVLVLRNQNTLLTLRGKPLQVVGLDDAADRTLFELGELAREPVVLVLGAEGPGLSRLVRERCDLVLAIPMQGRLGSLNVAAAAALACFEVTRQRQG